MKPKEIAIIAICIAIIAGTGYYGYTLLFPAPKTEQASTQDATATDTEKDVPTSIDEDTYKTINILSDYGKPNISGVGKSDLFAGF